MPQRPPASGSTAIGPSGVNRSYATWSWKRCVVIVAMIAVCPYAQWSAAMPACSRTSDRAPSAATTSRAPISRSMPSCSKRSERTVAGELAAGDPRRCESPRRPRTPADLPTARRRSRGSAARSPAPRAPAPPRRCARRRSAPAPRRGCDGSASPRAPCGPRRRGCGTPAPCRWRVPWCVRRSSGVRRCRAPRPRPVRCAARVAPAPAPATRPPGRRPRWRGRRRSWHRARSWSLHAPISRSISAGVRGRPSVSISQPSAVTATSSSMRTPMFHQRRGTPGVPAGM